jgi:hypothetical protein
MLGLFSVGHWSIDLDNPANRKFVAEFEKEYKRLPTGQWRTRHRLRFSLGALRRYHDRPCDRDRAL